MLSNVTDIRRAQQRISDGMTYHVCIRMAAQTKRVYNIHTA